MLRVKLVVPGTEVERRSGDDAIKLMIDCILSLPGDVELPREYGQFTGCRLVLDEAAWKNCGDQKGLFLPDPLKQGTTHMTFRSIPVDVTEAFAW